jgi:hypothetical protein
MADKKKPKTELEKAEHRFNVSAGKAAKALNSLNPDHYRAAYDKMDKTWEMFDRLRRSPAEPTEAY